MPKKYVVELSVEERQMLGDLVSKGRVLAQKRKHAQILLKADEGLKGEAWKDEKIAEAYDVSVRSVERIRSRFVEHGLEDALTQRRNPNGPHALRKLDGAAEARLTKIACSDPPTGRQSWTMQLLADHLVRLEIVEAISRETVRRTLKKTKSNRG